MVDVWVLVFRHGFSPMQLCRDLAVVCRVWRDAAHAAEQWRSIELSPSSSSSSPPCAPGHIHTVLPRDVARVVLGDGERLRSFSSWIHGCCHTLLLPTADLDDARLSTLTVPTSSSQQQRSPEQRQGTKVSSSPFRSGGGRVLRELDVSFCTRLSGALLLRAASSCCHALRSFLCSKKMKMPHRSLEPAQ